MKYNITLGMLATDAMTELNKASVQKDYGHYRGFLEKSAQFCRDLRRSYAPLRIDQVTQPYIGGAVMHAVHTFESGRPPYASAKLETISKLEPLINKILSEERPPTQEESIQIAEGLYESSAADYS
jgi:hypothetical protein